jgi:hypothetical protein
MRLDRLALSSQPPYVRNGSIPAVPVCANRLLPHGRTRRWLGTPWRPRSVLIAPTNVASDCQALRAASAPAPPSRSWSGVASDREAGNEWVEQRRDRQGPGCSQEEPGRQASDRLQRRDAPARPLSRRIGVQKTFAADVCGLRDLGRCVAHPDRPRPSANPRRRPIRRSQMFDG